MGKFATYFTKHWCDTLEIKLQLVSTNIEALNIPIRFLKSDALTSKIAVVSGLRLSLYKLQQIKKQISYDFKLPFQIFLFSH